MKTVRLIALITLGTLLLLIGIQRLADMNMTWRVRGDARSLQTAASSAAHLRVGPGRVHPGDLQALPKPVQTYLRYTGIVGRIPPATIALRQEGRFRTGPAARWMPFRARQFFTTDPPAFLWAADMRPMPLISIRGRDLFAQGKANMLIKALSLHKIADVGGPQMLQGAMLRYLSEMVWFPAAMLQSNIQWEPVNATSARARFRYHGQSVSGVFHFDHQGRFQSFRAMRYMTEKKGARLLPWSVKVLQYEERDGLRLPLHAQAGWHPPEGAFEYIQVRVTRLEYDALPAF